MSVGWKKGRKRTTPSRPPWRVSFSDRCLGSKTRGKGEEKRKKNRAFLTLNLFSAGRKRAMEHIRGKRKRVPVTEDRCRDLPSGAEPRSSVGGGGEGGRGKKRKALDLRFFSLARLGPPPCQKKGKGGGGKKILDIIFSVCGFLCFLGPVHPPTKKGDTISACSGPPRGGKEKRKPGFFLGYRAVRDCNAGGVKQEKKKKVHRSGHKEFMDH